ncbi:MAG: hypothetical protein ACRDNI_06425 [Gaiellaceae bacterium]
MLGRSPDDSDDTPPPSAPTAFSDVGDAVAGVLRAAEEAAEKIRRDASAQAIEIVEAAREKATARIDQLTREAERVRHDADDYAGDVRTAVDSYGSQQRREAEEEARKILSDAEEQARATREAAQEMAGQIEGEARRSHAGLREEIRSLEERRQRVLESLRELAAELTDLVPEPASRPRRAESELLDALNVEQPS